MTDQQGQKAEKFPSLLPGEIVLISSCLLGKKCRFDGGDSHHAFLIEQLKQVKVVPVCPEILGGLSVPREPSEVVGGDGEAVLKGEAKVRTKKSGQDLTGSFLEGARRTWELAQKYGAKKAVLKEKSPSCGVRFIYDGSFQGRLILGVGVTTAYLLEKGVSVYSERDWMDTNT